MANTRSRSRWLLLIFILIVLALLFRWDRNRSVKAIAMATVERQDIHTGVVTNGKAEPSEYREVRADVEGQIFKFLVHDGDEVRQGQKLIEIAQKQIASEIDRARAELANAEEALRLLKRGGTGQELRELQAQIDVAKRERDAAARAVAENERLLEKGAIARIELQQSRERLAKAESDLSVLEQKLKHRYDPEEIAKAEATVQANRAALNLVLSQQRSSSVVSPLHGTAYSLAVRVGDYVRPGDLLVRVGNSSQIRVRVYVDEPDLGKVTKGQPVVVTWDGLPGRQWQGEVNRLPSEIKELGTRKVGEVSCLLDNSKLQLLPNMNLNIEIITDARANVLTIPREAVFGTENNRTVYLVGDGRLVKQPVQTGISTVNRMEIRQGLKEGDNVALPTEVPLYEGMRVRSLG